MEATPALLVGEQGRGRADRVVVDDVVPIGFERVERLGRVADENGSGAHRLGRPHGLEPRAVFGGQVDDELRARQHRAAFGCPQAVAAVPIRRQRVDGDLDLDATA